MKIITCASYYSCGSSAITDLVSEYMPVKSLTEYEFRFLHDVDGVSDLEFQLVQCPNRHNSGHALKRFARLARFNHGRWFAPRFEPFFGGHYWDITREYISSLASFTYPGFWFYDQYDKGDNIYYWYSLLTKLHAKTGWAFLEPLPHEQQYAAHLTEQDFLDKTRHYMSQLFEAANPEHKPYLMLDQILPSSNIQRCMRYIAEPTIVFIVDRDPRDIYASAKKIWTKEHIAPTDTPEHFARWYRYTRECACNDVYNKESILKVRFEDLIYRYDEMVCIIEKMTGLEKQQHQAIFSKFNPRHSVVNTQLWKHWPDLEQDLQIIADLLPEYIYDFAAVENLPIAGIEPSTKNVF